MKFFRLLLVAGSTLVVGTGALFAASVEPIPLVQRAQESERIVRGTVESVTSRRGEDGIFSNASILVTEIFKGNQVTHFTLTYRGGWFENEGETVAEVPDFRVGEDRIFFLLDDNENFRLIGGPAGAPFSTSASLLSDLRRLFPDSRKTAASPPHFPAASLLRTTSETEGLLLPPRRTTIPDRDEPIGYLVDADFLPSGITLSQALEAVENALSAWSSVSSVQFRFDGLTSYGTAANATNPMDGRLRLQLHDHYGAIQGHQVLGIGGQWYRTLAGFPSGGSGGRVYSVEFHKTAASYVVLNHSATSMRSLPTFESVLAHEIGHALGLAHSSEEDGETDPELRQALMYFRAHARGAILNSWDRAAIARVHPLEPPPFGFDRFIRAVTSHAPLANNEVNQIRLSGYSIHADTLTSTLHEPTAMNGTFTYSDPMLTYRPFGAFLGDEIDPASDSYYDSVYIRYSDGTHLSPPVSVQVIAFLIDSGPGGAPDGLPNEWMETHFGSRFPMVGYSGPHDDPDGDGISNLHEFLSGTDPLDPNSRIQITRFSESEIEWRARPYDVYEIESSSDLANWEWETTIQPTTVFPTWEPSAADSGRRFYRIIRVD